MLDPAQPFDAGVVFVHPGVDRVNLDVTDHNGHHSHRGNVWLWDGHGDRPTNASFAEWMPYQRSLARIEEKHGQIDQGREFMWGAVGLHQLAAPPDGRISDAPFIWRDLPKGGIPEVVRRLKADARAVLGPGQPFEIRRAVPRMYGKGHGLAWVNGHLWAVSPADYRLLADGQEVYEVPNGGYYLVEQCWTDP